MITLLSDKYTTVLILLSTVIILCGCTHKTNPQQIQIDTAFNYIDDAESQGYDVSKSMD